MFFVSPMTYVVSKACSKGWLVTFFQYNIKDANKAIKVFFFNINIWREILVITSINCLLGDGSAFAVRTESPMRRHDEEMSDARLNVKKCFL